MNEVVGLGLLIGLMGCTSETLPSSTAAIATKPYDPLEFLITQLTDDVAFEYSTVCLERKEDYLAIGALRSSFSFCDSNDNPIFSLVDISYIDPMNRTLGNSIGLTLFGSSYDSLAIAYFNEYGDEVGAREIITRRPIGKTYWSEELITREDVFWASNYEVSLKKSFN